MVEILSYVLMPNHFHFTLKQEIDGGIAKFVGNFENSFTRYINIKNDRPGPLFQGRFKAVLIESDEQLIHLTRYHHLNPFADGVVSNFQELVNYPYSSLGDYLGHHRDKFVDTEMVLSFFSDSNAYKKFVAKQKDYKRSLSKIKKLLYPAWGKSCA